MCEEATGEYKIAYWSKRGGGPTVLNVQCKGQCQVTEAFARYRLYSFVRNHGSALLPARLIRKLPQGAGWEEVAEIKKEWD